MAPNSQPGAVEVVTAALTEHEGVLRGFVRARVPASEVDDVLQLAAIRAVERAESLQDFDRVLAWLYRLHRNVIADVRRQSARRERVIADGSPVPEIPKQASEPLCACSVYQLGVIGRGYGEILNLVDLGGYTLSEAAHVLGVSTNNATVRLHRARKALRNRLREHCGVTSLRDCVSCRCVDDGCCAA